MAILGQISSNTNLDKTHVGLSNVDNTSDANKPVSTATQTAINAKADDSAVVHDTGDETIAGIKTFSSSPIVPTPTTSTQAANKAYVDSIGGGGGGAVYDTVYIDTASTNYTALVGDTAITIGAADVTVTLPTPDETWAHHTLVVNNAYGDINHVDTGANYDMPSLSYRIFWVIDTGGGVYGWDATSPANAVTTDSLGGGAPIFINDGNNHLEFRALEGEGETEVYQYGDGGLRINTPRKFFNVKETQFGAIGDGTTDDTAAIQAAIDASNTAGGAIVFIPPGTYVIDPTTGINLYTASHLMGAGMYSTTFKVKSATDVIGNIIKAEGISSITVSDFSIDGNKATLSTDKEVSTNYGLYLGNASESRIERVRTVSLTGVGIHVYNSTAVIVTGCNSAANDYHGYEFEQVTESVLQGNDGHGNFRHGVFVSPGEVGGTGAVGNLIDGNALYDNEQYGVAFGIDAGGLSIGLTHNNIVSNNLIRNNGDYGISLYRVDDTQILGNLIEGSGKIGLYIYRSHNNIIEGNRFVRNSTDGDGLYDEILLQGATDGEGSFYNMIVNNFFQIDSGDGSTVPRANYAIREADAGDGSNIIKNNYIPWPGATGRIQILNANTTYELVGDSVDNRMSLRTFDKGVAIAPDATLPGSTMGIDAPFGTAALRFFNDNSGGNLQFVAPHGNADWHLGGNNTFSVTDSYATLHGYPIKEVDDPTDPQDAATKAYVDSGLSGKANDTAVVHKTGTETVAGDKTFSSPVTVATPTTSGHAATKDYVDKVRTFQVTVARSGTADYLADGTADDVQLQAAMDAVHTAGGGTIFVRAGTYRISATLVIPEYVRVIGEKFVKGGTGGTIFKTSASVSLTHMMTATGLTASDPSTNADLHHDIAFENITFDGNSTTTNILTLTNQDTCKINDCRFVLATNSIKTVWDSSVDPTASTIPGGLMLERCIISANSGIGVDLDHQTQCWITNTWFSGTSATTWVNVNACNKIHMLNCEFNTATNAVTLADTATFATNDIVVGFMVFAMSSGNKAINETRTNVGSARVEVIGTAASGVTWDKLAGSSNYVQINGIKAPFSVESQAAADKPLTLKGFASQSGRYIEAQNSSATAIAYLNSGGNWYVNNGSVSAVSYGFTSEINSGMYRVGAGDLGWSLAGVLSMELSSAGLDVKTRKILGVVDPTNAQEAATKNYADTAATIYHPSGTDVAIADGGTGASTKAAAFDALSPMTTSGDIVYGGTSGTGTRLAKGSDGNVLTLASGLPTWAAGGSGDMVLASTQTVSGAKTFNAGTIRDKGSVVFDVKAFGAVGNDSTDDTSAIQSAIDAANTAGGGTVWFPKGTYKITAALKLYSGTTPTITAYSNLTLAGAGASGTNGAILKQYTTATDVIKGLNDVANGAQSLNITIQDICLAWGTATLTNSGNGLYLAQQGAGGPSYQQFHLKNVTATNFQGSGKYGFNIESMIVSTIETCMAVTCANGFYLNGASGGAYNSVSTSVTFLNCYANMGTNGQVGYNILDNTYISFVGCACDIGANNSASAYLVDGSNCVTFQGCGVELNGTATLANGVKIQGGSSQVSLYGSYFYQSKTMVDIYVTGSSIGVTIVGAQDNSTISGSTGLKIDGGSQATEIDCNWGGVATLRTLATTAVWYTPGITRTQTVASSATPAINVGITDEFTITALAAAITSMTTNLTGTPVNGQKLIIRFKDNATARAITWGASFVSSGVATLLATTVISKTHEVLLKYNSTTSKWVCLAVDAVGY